MKRAAQMALILAAATAIGIIAFARPADAQLAWPVPGPVIAEFDPPYPDWLPGHRGIDVATTIGRPIRTPRDGVVSFAGRVAGTPVLVIGHGVLDATYLPATTMLTAGSPVAAGHTIGQVASGDHCLSACLHWGARANGRYVDPRILLGRYRVVLTALQD